ncbi:MAG: DMT family transporter [Oscillospiraceae bacterium]|nr:DMT family transporter [Oscillospiraceae bacterium]
MKTKERTTGRIQIAFAAMLWGLAGVCVKSITWGAMSLMAARSVISLIMLALVKRSVKVRWTKTNLLGAVMMSATGMLYVQSIKMTTAGTAIVLQYVAPILVFLYSVLFKKRKVRFAEVLITLAVFGGCVLSFADSLDPTRLVGNLLGLASGFTFAAQIIVMNSAESDSNDCLFLSNILSFLVCIPFVFTDSTISFDRKNILWVLILGVFQYGLGNILFGKGIQKIDRVEASLLLTIEPIFNPIPVAIFCGERMGTLALIGSAVVIGFVTLYSLLPQQTAPRKSVNNMHETEKSLDRNA